MRTAIIAAVVAAGAASVLAAPAPILNKSASTPTAPTSVVSSGAAHPSGKPLHKGPKPSGHPKLWDDKYCKAPGDKKGPHSKGPKNGASSVAETGSASIAARAAGETAVAEHGAPSGAHSGPAGPKASGHPKLWDPKHCKMPKGKGKGKGKGKHPKSKGVGHSTLSGESALPTADSALPDEASATASGDVASETVSGDSASATASGESGASASAGSGPVARAVPTPSAIIDSSPSVPEPTGSQHGTPSGAHSGHGPKASGKPKKWDDKYCKLPMGHGPVQLPHSGAHSSAAASLEARATPIGASPRIGVPMSDGSIVHGGPTGIHQGPAQPSGKPQLWDDKHCKLPGGGHGPISKDGTHSIVGSSTATTGAAHPTKPILPREDDEEEWDLD